MELIVGTDCSGIDAPIEALKRLGVPFRQVFAYEIDEKARRWLLAAGDAENVRGSMCDRKTDEMEEVDLYVCGFPCQLFSTLNRNQEVDLTDKRIEVLIRSLEYVDRKRPKVVIYENVPELMRKGRLVFRHILSFLEERYKVVKHTVLNASDYGAPQSRKRVYIVASGSSFEWPRPVRLKRSCMDGVEPGVVVTKLLSPSPYFSFIRDCGITQPGIISASCIRFKHSRNKDYQIVPQDRVSPCLVKTAPNLYYTHLRRYLTGRECLWLQGFQSPPPLPESNRVIASLAGNSMCVDVMCHLLKQVLSSSFSLTDLKVTDLDSLRDLKSAEQLWRGEEHKL